MQLAKLFGAVVTGVCSTAKLEMVRSLGADHVINYTAGDITQGGERYDLILDIAGRRPLADLRRILAPEGTLVIVGGEGGDKWFGGTHRQIGAMLLSSFIPQNLKTFISAENPDDLLLLTEYIEAGRLTPVIDRTYSLAEAADAIRHLEAGHACGKTVITV